MTHKHTSTQAPLSVYDVISFDIFDTLLARKIEKPIDIFYCVRAYLLEDKAFLCHPEILDNFPYLRIEAEQRARAEKIANGALEAEILLEDIYQQFSSLNHIDKKLLQTLQETEIFVEKCLSFAPKKGLELYQQAKSLKKKIILISDMYLPKKVVLDLLSAQGYDIPPENIFISGENGCSKHTGKLYRKIRNLLNLNPEKWLHIGDNKFSDIEQAKSFGIDTILADWSIVHHNPNIDGNLIKRNTGFIQSIVRFNQTIQAQEFYPEEPFAKIGYQIFGPLFFGFVCWLAFTFKSEKFEKIFFFARDAQLIQILYNQYMKAISPIPDKYLYVSRAALFPMSYTEWYDAKVHHLYNTQSKKYTVREILEKLGLIPEEFLSNIYQAGFSGLNDKIITQEEKDKAFRLITSLYRIIMENSAQDRKKYSGYLQDNISQYRKIGIVDIGWFGNMQSCFAKANIEQWHNLDIHCFYLCFFGLKENNSFYYHSNGWTSSDYMSQYLFSGGLELLEFALTANHGSTLGYQIIEGKTNPIFEEGSKEEKIYQHKAMLMRKGILKYFSDNKFLLEKFPLSAFINSEVWVQPFIRLVENPSLEEAELLGELTHSDVMGKTSHRLFLAKKLSEKELSNPDIYHKELERAFWKAGFRKRNAN